MTTIIATKNRMLSDTLIGGEPPFHSSKIISVKDSLIGFAGDDVGKCLRFVRWIAEGANLNDPPDNVKGVEIIQINGSEIILWDNHLAPIKIFDPVYSIGSGAGYALGAIDAGVSLEKALEIASKRDINTKPPFLDFTI
jgi:hypothetical protein